MNAGRPTPLWPGRPRPLPGETFSSWSARTAAANGLTSAELDDVATLGAHLHGRDLDRLAERSLLVKLAATTGIPIEILADTMLTRWAGHLYEPEEHPIRLPWLPSVGTERTRPSYGQQFCPLCLADDQAPYFRLRWRLSFVTACRHHRVLLVDRCHQCGEPLKAARTRAGIECHKCDANFLAAPATQVEDFSAKAHLLAAASQEKVELIGYPRFNAAIYSADVFFPFVDLHQETEWRPATERVRPDQTDFDVSFGVIAKVYTWLHIALGWFLSGIGVATVTDLVKRD